MSDYDVEALAESLHQEHAELGKRIGALKTLLDSRFEWPELETQLARLIETTDKHFEFEETGGYLDVVRARDPNRSAEVDALEEQHRQMRSDLSEIREAVGERADPEAIRGKLRAWIEFIARHEADENSLVQAVFNLEIGPGD